MTIVKALLTALVAGIGALVSAAGNGTLSAIDTKHWLLAALAVLGSSGLVWWCENGPWHTYIKTVVAFLSAGIGSLVLALNDNVITQAEWLTAFSVAVAATGLVFQVKNVGQAPPERTSL